jgi:regulator of cell morphogenesis and NO signaling
MFLHKLVIERDSYVSDIVKQDHHTVDVFRKYGIEYCCGGRWPLESVCLVKGLEFDQVKKELESAARTSQLPPALPFETWDIDFLTSYIIKVHHYFLEKSLPITGELVLKFAGEHQKNYPYMQEVYSLFEKLAADIRPHLRQEEETIFPYICQVAHAYDNKDSYARLLVKTLRKPLGEMIQHEHDMLLTPIIGIRELTDRYTAPEASCISHKVALSRLRELDNDIMQHIYLENEILFPRVLNMERELLLQ